MATENTENAKIDIKIKKPDVNGICWIAYFDILGFENLLNYTKEKLKSANLDVVAKIYHKQIIREIESELREQESYTCIKLHHFCISDSFVFFAPDDSNKSFLGMKWVAENFFIKMIFGPSNIPVRGSLTIGEFYADMKENIFIGQGLIEAYNYAEKQDWLGLVLTPMTCNKISETNYGLIKYLKDYIKYDVPVKEIKDDKIQRKTEKLFAFVYGRRCNGNIEDTICRMKDTIKERCGKDYENKFINNKYEKTLKFIRETSNLI